MKALDKQIEQNKKVQLPAFFGGKDHYSEIEELFCEARTLFDIEESKDDVEDKHYSAVLQILNGKIGNSDDHSNQFKSMLFSFRSTLCVALNHHEAAWNVANRAVEVDENGFMARWARINLPCPPNDYNKDADMEYLRGLTAVTGHDKQISLAISALDIVSESVRSTNSLILAMHDNEYSTKKLIEMPKDKLGTIDQYKKMITDHFLPKLRQQDSLDVSLIQVM